MIQLKKRSVLLLALWLVGFPATLVLALPVVVSNPKEQLDKVFRAEDEYVKKVIQQGKCWYVEYRMTSEIADPIEKRYKTVVAEGAIYATKDTRRVKSDMVETYVDFNDVFTINKGAKTVTRGRSTPKALSANGAVTQILRDSVLKQYTITSRTRIKEDGDSLTRFEMKGVTSNTQYRRLIFVTDDTRGMFRQIRAEINPAYSKELKAFTLQIKSRGVKAPDPSLKNLSNCFITNDEKLKPPYQEYRFVDLTKPLKRMK